MEACQFVKSCTIMSILHYFPYSLIIHVLILLITLLNYYHFGVYLPKVY